MAQEDVSTFPCACLRKDLVLDRYNDKKTVSGIIYLWDISQTRNTARHIIDIFCTPKPPRNVITATTKWSESSNSDEGGRDVEVCRYLETDQLPQFMNTQESAWNIIDRVLQREPFDMERLRELLQRMSGHSQSRIGPGSDFIAQIRGLLFVSLHLLPALDIE